MSNPTYSPVHLPSTELGSALAEQVTHSGDIDGFLGDIKEPNGYKDRTVEVADLAVSRFGVHGVINDDAYVASVLAHAASLLR